LEVAIINTISSVSVRAIPGPLTNVHSLETIALFGGFVLGAALCLATFERRTL